LEWQLTIDSSMLKNGYDSTIVKLLNVSYDYNSNRGIDGISLAIRKGEFATLVGRTGSGKTTLFRIISLELFPDSGEVMLLKMKSSQIKRKKLPEWRRQLGIVFQGLQLIGDRSVLDNIRLAALCERRLSGSAKSRSLHALSQVGMAHRLHDRAAQLSTGEQQRVAIARAIVNEPFVLLADEPVSNLDAETSSEVINILQKINSAGTAVVVATHQPERFAICNPREIRLEHGKVVES